MKEERKWEKGERITKLAAELANVCISAYEDFRKDYRGWVPYKHIEEVGKIAIEIGQACATGWPEETARLIFELAQELFKAYLREAELEESIKKGELPSLDTQDKSQGGGR